jgi:putative ABC transport system substrate-binding protein
VDISRVVALILGIASAFLGFCATPFATEAQPAPKAARVGVLGVTPIAKSLSEAFAEGLGQSGRAQGRTLVVDQRSADGLVERLPDLVADLVRLKVDVVFARGPAALMAIKKATNTIPIVAVDMESDPMALGLAKNLSRPGGNVTGVFLDLPEMSGKQIQLFKEIVPGVTRVAVLGDPKTNAAQFRATEAAARTLGVQLQVLDGRTSNELESALESARRAQAGAVILLSSPIVFADRARIADLAVAKGLPAVSLFAEFAEAGGLMSYGPSLTESVRRCGTYVGKILAGAKPGDLPIERPEKFELVINLKTAQALRLTIPQLLQLRATQLVR